MLTLAQDLAPGQGFVHDLLAEGELIPFIAIAGAFLTAILLGLGAFTWITMVSRSREQTKRELAAYVAEGSLNASQAVAILTSGQHGGISGHGGGSGLREEIGRLVARIA